MYVCKYIQNLTNIVIQRPSVFSVSKAQGEIFAVIEYFRWNYTRISELKLHTYFLNIEFDVYI